jgi:hypothetical protein
MFTRSNLAASAAFLLGPGIVFAQLPQGSLAIDFPKDSPVAVASGDWGQSRPAARGGALVLDLHTSLSLRNITQKRIRSVTLLVLAQEVTPGGKGSVSVPSLDVGPDETFPVRIDLRLLRPLGAEGALVRVGLDGVLFDDLTFYGPNRLNSRRSMMVWELEAQRDRRYYRQVLAQGGSEALQKEMLASIVRLDERAQTGVQVVRGPSTNIDPGHDIQFAFLQMPDSPIEPLEGSARIIGDEARAPRLDIRNRSSRAVRYVDLGWVVQDQQGREFLAGSVPADIPLAPGQKARVTGDTALRFTGRSPIQSMLGFVNHVEFEDGKYWIPSRSALADPRLQKVVAPSPEEQHLVQIYRKKGLKALIEELKRP